MTKEIKEILVSLNSQCKTAGAINSYFRVEHIQKLLDYITNLQQENERLKENRDWWKDRFFGQQEYDDSHRITAIEYRKRIDKAVLFINENNLDYYSNEEKLLSILQNGSDSE